MLWLLCKVKPIIFLKRNSNHSQKRNERKEKKQVWWLLASNPLLYYLACSLQRCLSKNTLAMSSEATEGEIMVLGLKADMSFLLIGAVSVLLPESYDFGLSNLRNWAHKTSTGPWFRLWSQWVSAVCPLNEPFAVKLHTWNKWGKGILSRKPVQSPCPEKECILGQGGSVV